MHHPIYIQIQQNPRFQELVSKRERFAWLLSALMLGMYLAFILVIAFVPQWLGTRIDPESTTTWGIPVGLGVIISAFVLTGIYVYRANGEFDDMTREILAEVQK
ncbi:MAG: DUF485 domain-containing protein [Pseudomonadota bacterium]